MLVIMGPMPRTPERPSARVLNDLRRRVQSQEWRKDEALPTVSQLADHYVVSRATAARALKLLEQEGLVRVVARWGTFRA